MKRHLAVLMCSFNRKSKTVEALSHLYNQKSVENIQMDIYLVDDGSTDGTANEVKSKFPNVNVIKGNGNYYWNGGMRVAYEHAKKNNYDFYLWMNDDTFIYENALNTLISSYDLMAKEKRPKIIVGSTKGTNGEISYGGVNRYSKFRPVKFKLVMPHIAEPKMCDTFNGNIVLIDKKAYKLVGNLDESFIHGMGDFDFGLRAKKRGAIIFIAPSILGICDRNSISGTYNDTNQSLLKGIKKMISIKGLPIKQWYIFNKRHAGIFWLIYFAKPYIEFVPLFIFRKYIK